MHHCWYLPHISIPDLAHPPYLERKWCREKSTLIFCAIPTSFYIAARIYFGVAFLIFDKIVPFKFKKYGINIICLCLCDPYQTLAPYSNISSLMTNCRVDRHNCTVISCAVWTLLPAYCEIATAIYLWDDSGGYCGYLIWYLQTRDNKGDFLQFISFPQCSYLQYTINILLSAWISTLRTYTKF